MTIFGAIFSTTLLALGMASLNAQAVSQERCKRISQAVRGGSYLRSNPDFPGHDQVWHFVDETTLRIRQKSAKNRTDQLMLWKFQFEDQACQLKVAANNKPDHWMSYRLEEVTWAIITRDGRDHHIPDFRDHSGSMMKFCNSGANCSK